MLAWENLIYARAVAKHSSKTIGELSRSSVYQKSSRKPSDQSEAMSLGSSLC
jgi:hypothetical protein